MYGDPRGYWRTSVYFSLYEPGESKIVVILKHEQCCFITTLKLKFIDIQYWRPNKELVLGRSSLKIFF